MLKVISFTICPFVQRITALLEAKGLPYEVEYIQLNDKPQWFLDISPNGQVPLLQTEAGEVLFESDAIAEYLEDAYPPLQPGLSPVQVAHNRAWSYLGSKQYLIQCPAMGSKDGDSLKQHSAKLASAFAKVEKVLGGQRYFNSDSLSMVDLAWLPVLHRAWIIKQHSGYDFVAGYPKTQAWQQALMDTGLGQRSVADDFLEKFSAYYLSEQTVLGRIQRHCQPCQCQADTLDECCGQQQCRDILASCEPKSSSCGDSGCCG
ncbi:glutathione S-transferase family protein [Ferrimonas sp. SCSIO 43195]|uniref:glutathione S-transferase family protein n=1 Tax=Ferrimonas sp. SCSIO 43195 TaxID=2822844 RepID=UPI0020756386|nr:glutathione S-transferase family protein [Ferrimonas sp. SCSIO 43195]USD37658.1 glutathione S-transferase family protein [Ferrimonas sp. SCSIO 43195]